MALVGIVAWSNLGSASGAPVESPVYQQPAPSDPPLAQVAAATAIPRPIQASNDEAYLVAAREQGRSRLWAYASGASEPTRLTAGEWDDHDPVANPSGDRLAFSSNRGGSWDLYLLELGDQTVRQLTGTPGYEGRPTWSPDGRWLAFEAYYDGDFDIWILPIDGSQSPIQLTDGPAADLLPAWDPGGRRIAFVSDRSGEPDIYLADLDQPTDRFRNLTHTDGISESEPAFSPDGARLAYSVAVDGVRGIQLLDLADPGGSARWVGQGSHPTWSAGGQAISAVLRTQENDYVVSYPLVSGVPPLNGTLSGRISALDWTSLAVDPKEAPATDWEGPLYETVLDRPLLDNGRLDLIPLDGVSPDGLLLSDAADEAFAALRSRVAYEAGWDLLGNLQHGFVGINDPLPPGYAYNDWLYTGRAFSLNPAALQAGWLEVVREDFGQETYWRVYVRTLAQDGSQGEPLRNRPWNFSTRFAGDPAYYDAGGSLKESIPTGYYVDLTTLAADYGFERLPALPNWRSFYPGSRYEEFALRESLDWAGAMSQLYPASAIATPTAYQTPTPTPTNTPRPTPTPWWWRWRTPTPTLPPAATPTPSP